MDSRSRPALIALALALGAGCSSSPSGDYAGFWSGLGSRSAPEIPTDRLADEKALTACPTKKCLTVYLAPWCPHCREAAPAVIALRDYLKDRGVQTKIIIGQDRPQALVSYAKQFGPDTLIDERGAVAANGVPHFFVTDDAGKLLLDQPGIPAGVTDPAQLAAVFGLP